MLRQKGFSPFISIFIFIEMLIFSLKQVCYFISSILGLLSSCYLLVYINIPREGTDILPGTLPIGVNATVFSTPLTIPAPTSLEFYLFSTVMGGAAAMVVVLSLTSTSDLIDDNTVINHIRINILVFLVFKSQFFFSFKLNICQNFVFFYVSGQNCTVSIAKIWFRGQIIGLGQNFGYFGLKLVRILVSQDRILSKFGFFGVIGQKFSVFTIKNGQNLGFSIENCSVFMLKIISLFIILKLIFWKSEQIVIESIVK